MPSEAPLPPVLTESASPKIEVARTSPRVIKSANWFWWIAGLSVINSVSSQIEGGVRFVVGLGFTELSDAVFHSFPVIDYSLDLIAVGFFVTMGFFARKGCGWAFVVGGVLYAIDALIYAYFQHWLPVAFHAYALFWIYQGFSQLRALNSSAASTAAP